MTDTYDPAQDSFESYNAAIAALRAKLLRERCPAAKRVEVIGGCELYLGDCMEIMPVLGRVDAVVTDPPYGIDGGKGGDAKLRQKGAYLSFVDTPENIEASVIPAISFALSIADRGAITPGNRCLHMYPKSADIGCFYHPAAMAHGPWGFVGFSPILFYGRDFRAGKGSLPSSRVVTETSAKVDHPCPKPIKAWEWLFDKVTQGAETVLDPFMGSGTGGIVSARLGRRFIGIEIEEKYFDIACDRIRKAYSQPDMFVRQPSEKAAQEAML